MVDGYLWYNVLSDHHTYNIMNIIYIHGFNSGGSNNDKSKMLAAHFDHVIALDLPHSPDAAIGMLIDEIAMFDDLDDIILVGSSLGGFYAHFLAKTFGLKVVLINPSMDPSTTLKQYIGTNKNYATGVSYEFTQAHIDELADYYVDPASDPIIPVLVCLDMADEVLDAAATAELFKDTAKVITFEGGNHRFTHMKEILPEIAKLEHVIHQTYFDNKD